MRYRIHNGELVPSHLIPRGPSNRSHLPSPMLIRDDMDAAVNPATGMLYESKSAFRKATRAAGCYEVGNDAPNQGGEPAYEAGPDRELAGDIKQAMEQLGHG